MNKYQLLLEVIKKHAYKLSAYDLPLFAVCDLAIRAGSPQLSEEAVKVFDITAGELFADGFISFGNKKLLEDVKNKLQAELQTYGLQLGLQ